MESIPQRRTRELQRGRVSIPHARYFCTLRFQSTRASPPDNSFPSQLFQSTQLAVSAMTANGDWQVLCGTMMPDHLHLLVVLGRRLTVSQCVAKLKVTVRHRLSNEAGECFVWQRNFFEHRLRPEETSESCVLYIFLNPYRANLVARTASWPGWWRVADFQWKFEAMLESGCFPPAAWLAPSNPDPAEAAWWDS